MIKISLPYSPEPYPDIQEQLEQSRQELGDEEFLNRLHALYLQKQNEQSSTDQKQPEISDLSMGIAEEAVRAHPGLTLEKSLEEILAHGG